MTTILSLTFNPVSENTYLVFDNETREAIIFDPGCFTNAEEALLAKTIADHQLIPVKLINTHCHFDHIFGNDFVMKKYGLKLGIHELEKDILQLAPAIVNTYGLPPMDASFEVLFCPGHSPGSICFYNAAENYLIAGDVLFNGSIGRTDLPGGDHQTLLGSIMTKLLPLPDETVVWPGHGGNTTIGKERTSNPFLT